MAFGRRNQEEIVKEETVIWECTANDCNCWIRDNFKSSDHPTCPMCKSEMVKTTRVIEVINNPQNHF